MTFLNFIKNSFDRVLSLDTEFRFDETMTIPKKVLCFCYMDIFTGEKWEFWEYDKPTKFGNHFDNTRNLIISYVATAEIGCYLNLNHPVPPNVIDLFVEVKRLYLDKRERGKFKMLDIAQMYGLLDVMTKEEKDKTRDLIIYNEEYSSDQRREILDYCMSDVEIAAEIFKCIIEDIETRNKLKTAEDYSRELWQMMFRGSSITAIAKIEKNGIPIDNYKLNQFNKYWPEVKDKIILKYNKEIDCFDGTTFNHKKFENLIINKLGLDNWPRSFRSGQLTVAKETLKKYAEKHHELKILLEIRTLQNMTKLKGYEVSFDGRARTSLNMFGTVTGRCTPSTAKFPFSTGKWARNFIKGPWGSNLVYIDYSQQEVAIQGYLSKDQNLINAYNSGDVYLATAKLCKAVPEHATKDTHEKERDIFKILFLANSYGAGEEWIASQIKTDVPTARAYKKLFKKMYRVYFNWIENFINAGFLKQVMTTCYGWQRFLSNRYTKQRDGKIKSLKNSIQNWPIQSHGSEVLRQAILDLTEEGFKIIAPVHDALLLEIPKADIYLVEHAKQIMVNASMKVVGGPIRVDADIIESNYKQLNKKGKPTKDQKMFDTIFKEVDNFINLSRHITPGQEPITVRSDLSV